METVERTLAIDGGEKAVQRACKPRERWGEAERKQLEIAASQSSLFYWNGEQTRLLIERFQKHYPLKYVMPNSSGTAAIHIAVAAAGVGPGDEVITSPITDMGTVIGVLYQQGVPVFADLDARTYNLDPQSVREKITPRTKAIIAVHLTGNPCAMQELKAIAEEYNLVLIEDCAQAWGAMYRGQPVGTIGDIGCWSLNDFKHIGCGDGGMVASNDERFGPLLQKFGDKAYDRTGGGGLSDVLAPNYRISELQSAFAAAQMERMWEFTEKRGSAGRLLNELIKDVPGVLPHGTHPEDRWTCWFYLFRIDPAAFTCDRDTFVQALAAEGAPATPGYLPVPLYRYPVFQNHNFFNGGWPLRDDGHTTMDYRKVSCPETKAILETSIRINVAESTEPEYIEGVGEAIKKVASHYRR